MWVISLFVNIVSLFHTTYENTYLWNLLIAPELIFDNRILIFGQYLKDYSFQAKQLLINLRKGGVSPILAMSESRAKKKTFRKFMPSTPLLTLQYICLTSISFSSINDHFPLKYKQKCSDATTNKFSTYQTMRNS